MSLRASTSGRGIRYFQYVSPPKVNNAPDNDRNPLSADA